MGWLRRLWNAARPGAVERDIAREVSFHLAERADQLRAAGLSEREARRQARRQFGNPSLQAERIRDADVSAWLDALVRNARYGARTLGRTPGFTATAVLTLALGIGANAAVFSALDAVLLRPLPFPDADRLMRVHQVQDGSSETFPVAPARLADWDRFNSTFDAITGYYVEDVSETSGDLPERVRRAVVAPRFLEVWGLSPALGRGFSADEHRLGGPPAVLISDRYWRTRLTGAPPVLQRTVRIGVSTYPIVGVMPPAFRFPDRTVDLWFPVSADAPYAQSRDSTWYTVVGRLKPGVTAAQAHGNLEAVQAQLREQYPETDRLVGVRVEPLKQTAVARVGPSLWLLFGAVSILLLIACTNIAALLVSRGAHRQHEIAVRLSLGASRATIAGQLLIETAILAAAGGALGLAVAAWASQGLRSAAADLPRIEEVTLDGRILLYTLATTTAVALLCGILPALRAAGSVPARPGGADRVQVSVRNRLQWTLVGLQVALSVVLLAAAGLLVRSFHELSRVDPGFEAAGVLSFRVSGSWGETADYDRLTARIDGTLERLRAIPGVESAATTGWTLPGVPEPWEATFELAEGPAAGGRTMVAEGRAVSPEYFETMRIPLIGGALCRRPGGDGTGTPSAVRDVMVNRAFAVQYLSDRPSPLGLHLRDAAGSFPTGRIAGVVGDARERGLDREPGPTVYACLSAPNPTPHFLVRTRGEPLAVAPAIRGAVKEIAPLRSVYQMAPLEEQIDEAFTENRLRAAVVTLFAATALSLACLGLYGTVGYAVGLRRREIGLRLALGAGRAHIVRQFLRQGLQVAALACAGGLALSIACGHVLSGMLFGVSASDPLTLAAVSAIVIGVAALATLIPATRAAFVQPMQVLRDQ